MLSLRLGRRFPIQSRSLGSGRVRSPVCFEFVSLRLGGREVRGGTMLAKDGNPHIQLQLFQILHSRSEMIGEAVES